jgi:hypothetical protein
LLVAGRSDLLIMADQPQEVAAASVRSSARPSRDAL